MRVLLAGGNEVLQRSIIRALVERAHEVRLLSNDAVEQSAEWSAHVEPWPDDRGTAAEDRCAATAGMDAAIIVDVSADANAAGNRRGVEPERVADAAAQTGLRRLVLVRGNGPDPHPASHAEELTAGFPREWLVLRTAPVYGVGDDPITLFLIMMRTLPAVPLMSDSHVMRPLWHGDLARALAAAVSLPSTAINRVIEIAGPAPVTQRQLYDRIAAMIDRRPLRIPVSDFLAAHGSRLAEALRSPLPFEPSHLPFARAASADGSGYTALPDIFRVAPTGLSEGLERLIQELAELEPSHRYGALEVKRFSADIRGSRYTAPELLRVFRAKFREVMPIEIGVEPAVPQTALATGAVIAMALPGGGHVQVRVEDVTDERVVLATLRGHALAGIVWFSARAVDGAIRFEVMPCDTAANLLDWVTVTVGGARFQDLNWARVVESVVTLSGGNADGVQHDARRLEGEEANDADRWVRSILRRKRADDHEADIQHRT